MNAPIKIYPMDEHNKTLIANVHPNDWINPQPSKKYNLVIIGAGTAGLITAAGAAKLGAKVALVERHLMGGDCLNTGCVPSKSIISSARVAETIRLAKNFGVEVPIGTKVNFAKTMERLRELRAGFSLVDSASRFSELGIDVFLGQASFFNSNTIYVAGKRLQFKKAVIATGARPSAPYIPGLTKGRYMDNESIFSLTKQPIRFGVIGAGPTGCEIAQSFACFGSEVHLIESTHGILPKEDQDCAEIVKNALIKSGVFFHCCSKAMSISDSNNKIRVKFQSHGNNCELILDQLLVAVGRTPNVEGLELEKVGVYYNKKGVKVDKYYRTSNPNIFAAGDVCSAYQFTHAADFMARAVIQNSLFSSGPFGRKKSTQLTIPWCTYTTPELAHVGLSKEEAKKRNVTIDSYIQKLEYVDRAILEGKTEGIVKVNCAKGSDRIVGATIVAANAGDMIAEICLAITNRIGLKKIAETIHPYPTQADAIRKTGDIYNCTRLTPIVKTIFSKWLAWQRR